MTARLPLTVIGGYLGAGKTTFINRVLAADLGLRLLVMVNDFGAINIDADLLASASEDTMELTNGCVCCTMGADLFMAIGDVLDRRPRPDHLLIEASGIADPARIANVARAEPDLRYGGIVTVVDALQAGRLLGDAHIGAQVADQIRVADLLLLTKAAPDTALNLQLAALSPAPRATTAQEAMAMILNPIERGLPEIPRAAHPAHLGWSYEGPRILSRPALAALIGARPPALFRLKGMVRAPGGTGLRVQVVGQGVEITDCPEPDRTRLVGIGIKGQLDPAAVSRWWEGA